MERSYEYLRRLAVAVPEKEKERVLSLADQLEKLGRVHAIKLEDKQNRLAAILQENGIFLSEADSLAICEPWDRKAK